MSVPSELMLVLVLDDHPWNQAFWMRSLQEPPIGFLHRVVLSFSNPFLKRVGGGWFWEGGEKRDA